jgi:hypothetical protein
LESTSFHCIKGFDISTPNNRATKPKGRLLYGAMDAASYMHDTAQLSIDGANSI